VEKKGILIVYTGEGKGKTTAALGIALRAAGYTMKTIMVQFIKGTREYGEIKALPLMKGLLEIYPMGRGFYHIRGDSEPEEEHKRAAREALRFARDRMLSGKYDIVVLDEINIALHLGLLKLKEVLEFIEIRPPEVTLVLTGRNAHPKVVEKADLVTEMKEIKHPFRKGILAIKGIDF